MLRKLVPWLLFLGCILVLGLGTTSFGRLADYGLILLRLSLVIALSVFVVLEKVGFAGGRKTFYQFFKTWCRGESRPK